MGPAVTPTKRPAAGPYFFLSYAHTVGCCGLAPLSRVNLPRPVNQRRHRGVDQSMKPIRDEHIAEPGLVVVDVAAADDNTALAFQEALARIWATAPADRTTRTPGEPGVGLRCYLDLRQELSAVVGPTREPAMAQPDS